MHHEDRAGVDALLAGVDGLAAAQVPVLVVLCTNRLAALDPAVLRRAAATFTFDRPTAEQRHTVLVQALGGINITDGTVTKLVDLTGPDGDRPGFTFSDLTQRLIPTAVLRAFPHCPVDDVLLLEVAADLQPTPVFGALP
jgi:SpoVK/Ycf46/Vps4 family AAA+-type ATPase